MAGALRNAARALAAGMRTQSGVQSRGMAKKTAFYSPNVPLENWASERESVFQKFKWDGDAWKTFIIYIVLVPGTLYYAFASEHQLKQRVKYGLALDLPGMPYGLDKTGVDEHMKQMQEVKPSNRGWFRGGDRI